MQSLIHPRVRTVCALLVAVLVASACQSSGPAAAPDASPSAPSAPASIAPATPEMQRLSWFAGDWRCISKNTPPDEPPYDSVLHATGRYDLSGQWFIWRSAEQPSPQIERPVSFMGVWGWDSARKMYVTSHFDNTGLRALQFSPGWKGPVFDLPEGTLYLQGRPGIPFREIFTKTGPDSFSDDMLFKLGTEWKRIIIAYCTRSA